MVTNEGGFEWQTDALWSWYEDRLLYKGQLLVFLPVFFSESDALKEFDQLTRMADPTREEVQDFWKNPTVNFQNTFDAKVTDWVSTEVLKRHNWDLTNYPEVRDRLLHECERAKIRLSKWERVNVDLSKVDPELESASEPITLHRSVLDELAEQLVRRTFATCVRVLGELGLEPRDLDSIVMAGGSTHLPMVRRGVEAYFGKPGRDDLEPTEVVALGASRPAA